jgi:hypothetical protein
VEATPRQNGQTEGIAVTDLSQMTDEELIARLGVLNEQLAPFVELRANEVGESDPPQPN